MCISNTFNFVIVLLCFTINVTNLIISSFVSWFRMLSQYGEGIVFFLGFGRAIQISQDDVGITFKLHNFVQVVHYTINVKNFTIPLFI
jgi:hypothetical protein